MTTVCFTSLTYGYLSRARVLAATLRAAHPDWPLCAVLVDRPPPGLDAARALAVFDRTVDAEDLIGPDARAWLFKHDIVEACTAVKAAMLQHLLAGGADRVVYLDPDIAVFHPLAALDGAYAAASALLTPHQTAPNRTALAVADNEAAALRYGVFNLGFLAVRNDAHGRGFAAWWAARLREACYDDPAAGLFTDQKYCDLAPALFDGVAVVRDPGWNVASWNLSQRRLSVSADGELLANGARLAFYHFTKFGGVGATMMERYAGDDTLPHELWHWYARQLAAHAEPAVPDGWWHYGRFACGARIARPARLLWRQRPDLHRRFPDPFASAGDCLRTWLQAHAPDALAADTLAADSLAADTLAPA